ncbi:MAG TPA: SAVED domain-containing protein [Polyangium sp.]|nr:SAVED domain-containing protein [Polyangium sp.]
MLDSKRLLVVAHPMLTGIGQAEIDRQIPKSPQAAGFDFVEIAPLRTSLADLYDLEWAAVHEAQEALFVEKLRPHLERRGQIAYFGLAPIPLAIHLGYRVQSTTKINVYQRHHDRQDWSWAPKNRASTRPFLEPIQAPERGSSAPGELVIRVSTSARIAPADTEVVVPRCLAAVDIALVEPNPDAFETREALESVAAEFSRTLTRLMTLFPNATTIHLFAAVPVGLAFLLGSRINPTMNPDVVTYQFDAKRSPKYKKAIVLGAHPIPDEAQRLPKERPPWRGKELVTGRHETFLDISFLHEGLRMAQAVVFLRAYHEKHTAHSGTGFLIAPNTILTNHHVLFDHDDHDRRVHKVTIRFHYEYERPGQLRVVEDYFGDVESIVGDKTHDWAVIRSKTPIKTSYPFMNLHPRKPVELNDYVYIIQHPGGRPKKIGLLHNEVLYVDQNRVQYLTDTLPGSSGSPVCNEYWEVVALHNTGITDPTNAKAKYRNEGVHIDRVVEGLRAHKIID